MQINETENRKTLEEINKIKNWFIENINKRDNIYQDCPRKREQRLQLLTPGMRACASLTMLQQQKEL